MPLHKTQVKGDKISRDSKEDLSSTNSLSILVWSWITMQTVTDLLRSRVELILEDARVLFAKHSKVKEFSKDRDFIIVRLGTHGWEELPQEGQQIASRVRERYDHFSEVIKVLIRTQDEQTLRDLDENRKLVRTWIDQTGSHCFKSGLDAFAAFDREIKDQLGLLNRLYDARAGEHIYVPDTVALICNPKLEEWSFPDSAQFTLILTPTVLGELDKHKANERNESVQKKAKQLVNQLKEYRRRGKLSDGVTIRANKINLRAIAVEPDFTKTLQWLDKENNDDRILAGVIEVMRQHPRCPVLLVTADINLMNKVDYAGLPCVYPPEPILSTP